MPTEAEVLAWLSLHWQSLALAGVMAKAYLKLRGFVVRLETIEKRQKRLMRICSAQHKDLGAQIFDDGDGDQ